MAAGSLSHRRLGGREFALQNSDIGGFRLRHCGVQAALGFFRSEFGREVFPLDPEVFKPGERLAAGNRFALGNEDFRQTALLGDPDAGCVGGL